MDRVSSSVRKKSSVLTSKPLQHNILFRRVEFRTSIPYKHTMASQGESTALLTQNAARKAYEGQDIESSK